ncbi:type II toxin-antitoxin system RelE/ParE family toxin [Paucibacter sp. PLA-PC-4]|uniref:type II toxin-antitoxin system RelE/ParE family toxin n=1 Tax=Paucibacter sp. PLA-PC-4 TaxID=2993655 RepID=UPI00224A5394|nr:type II toxin-antitoxin system RelE/ParE family toxin [Paucibacter sp. PLA-PC-4]MCX2865522.1 type II toxin-antitoxin system RelE/ParE family toxin [Paucibacter sp. PLA-PC-4]
MTYQVFFSPEAEEDLQRLFSHADERELHSAAGDLDIPERAIDATEQAPSFLRVSPFSCRKVGGSGLVRELVIPFEATGYVAMFEIADARTVVIGAVRHQRETDFH